MPAGADSVFAFSAVTPANGLGELASTFSIVVSGDPDLSNNSASASTQVGQ
jgi:hypothetical protein